MFRNEFNSYQPRLDYCSRGGDMGHSNPGQLGDA